MKIALFVAIVTIISLSKPIEAEELAPYLYNIQKLESIYPEHKLDSLPNDKPTVILVFKACCSSNMIALRWGVKLHTQYGDSINIIGIAIDNPKFASKVKSWLNSRDVKFPCFWNSNRDLIKWMSIKATPTLFVLNGDGVETYSSKFFSTNDMKQVEELLPKLIKR